MNYTLYLHSKLEDWWFKNLHEISVLIDVVAVVDVDVVVGVDVVVDAVFDDIQGRSSVAQEILLRWRISIIGRILTQYLNIIFALQKWAKKPYSLIINSGTFNFEHFG